MAFPVGTAFCRISSVIGRPAIRIPVSTWFAAEIHARASRPNCVCVNNGRPPRTVCFYSMCRVLWLRNSPALHGRVHFWPFDGFEVPEGQSVIAEAYPALYKRRFAKNARTPDEHDAWSIAAWLREADRRRVLERYFMPPLLPAERKQAVLEGWILGVW